MTTDGYQRGHNVGFKAGALWAIRAITRAAKRELRSGDETIGLMMWDFANAIHAGLEAGLGQDPNWVPSLAPRQAEPSERSPSSQRTAARPVIYDTPGVPRDALLVDIDTSALILATFVHGNTPIILARSDKRPLTVLDAYRGRLTPTTDLPQPFGNRKLTYDGPPRREVLVTSLPSGTYITTSLLLSSATPPSSRRPVLTRDT